MKKVNNIKLKFKVWDQFGKPVDKFKLSPKEINKRVHKILKKYE